MFFANWLVTDKGIEWKGEADQQFYIPLAELNQSVVNRNGQIFYDWILKATNEVWLTPDDLYDLNFAFAYAAGKYSLEFDYSIFDATLAEQFELIDDEDEDEDEDY
jgi:hypothetical protein